jgi:hypothetical protein
MKKTLGKKKSLEQLKIMNRVIKVVEFGNVELNEAIYLMEKDEKFSDLEDTIQFVMARKKHCDYIITNDKNFYSYEVPLLTSGGALGVI